MPRLFYDTSQKVYNLFKNHPTISSLLAEFKIDIDEESLENNLRDVCDYLIENDLEDEIQEKNLSFEYTIENSYIETLAELYGFPSEDLAIYTSEHGVKLTELLYMTLYLYKFGSLDNFYAKNIFRFIPENDREYILSQPKLKLTVEALGRKLDDLEDRIARMQDVTDIDKTPEILLDYLGQNLGYEREHFSLSSVSFRELLKNIIEIYKIKGTNYSFSFFFKFLGFDVELKEFFFNRDVLNPESFPGTKKDDVEYFLTTTNPTMETGDDSQEIYLSPAKFLGQTRNLNEWGIEYRSLAEHGCINASEYMRGLESFNGDEEIWHQSPWNYFKTNLIEYKLTRMPSLADKGLSWEDNETITKYVKFLSPTYLFTWVNVNLIPWEELLDSMIDNLDSNNAWLAQINQMLGDPRPSMGYAPWPVHEPGSMGVPDHEGSWIQTTSTSEGFNGLYNDGNYLDYEDMGYYLQIYNSSSPGEVQDLNKEHLLFSIQNLMNLDGIDQVGTYLRRNGVHIRQPGHPKFITNAFHSADSRMAFDNVGIQLKLFDDPETTYDLNGILIDSYWKDYSDKPWPAIPVFLSPFEGSLIKNVSIVNFEWDQIDGQLGYWIQVSSDRVFNSLVINDDSLINSQNFYTSQILHNDRYYWRIRVKNQITTWNPTIPVELRNPWSPWTATFKFTLQNLPFPYDSELLNYETIYVSHDLISEKSKFEIAWPKEVLAERYKIQVSKLNDFTGEIKYDDEVIKNHLEVELLNGIYYWRYIAKNINEEWPEIEDAIVYSFAVNF